MKSLPHLLKLLDDDSDIVRAELSKKFVSYGCSLDALLENAAGDSAAAHDAKIGKLVTEYSREALRKSWKACAEVDDDLERLEAAMSLLAEYQFGFSFPIPLRVILDELAEQFVEAHPTRDAYKLARFLFSEKALKGAHKDYYNPRNSNLIYVILKKQGIPISLAITFMLVGKRVGLDIEGFHMPGHFLARISLAGKKFLVDCYNGGRFMDEKEVRSSQKVIERNANMDAAMNVRLMLRRVLNNLATAYERTARLDDRDLMKELLESTN